MEPTLLVGLAVVALGTGVGAIVMFGQRANSLGQPTGTTGTIPLTEPATTRRLTSASARLETPEWSRPPVPRGLRSNAVHLRWYQRVRAGLVLALIAVGIGMAFGAVLGFGALLVSLYLG